MRALYAGMVEWAGIAGDDTYYEWLKEISQKNSHGHYYVHDNPLRRYHADDYCVGQTYIELYRKYKDKNMIKPMRTYLDQILKDPAKGDLAICKYKRLLVHTAMVVVRCSFYGTDCMGKNGKCYR